MRATTTIFGRGAEAEPEHEQRRQHDHRDRSGWRRGAVRAAAGPAAPRRAARRWRRRRPRRRPARRATRRRSPGCGAGAARRTRRRPRPRDRATGSTYGGLFRTTTHSSHAPTSTAAISSGGPTRRRSRAHSAHGGAGSWRCGPTRSSMPGPESGPSAGTLGDLDDRDRARGAAAEAGLVGGAHRGPHRVGRPLDRRAERADLGAQAARPDRGDGRVDVGVAGRRRCRPGVGRHWISAITEGPPGGRGRRAGRRAARPRRSTRPPRAQPARC